MEDDQDDDRVPLTGADPPTGSRLRPFLLPALTVASVLILIIVVGASNTKLWNRLRPVEQSVSELGLVVQSLNSSLVQAQETAKGLQSSVENIKEQLTSVSEALKQLSTVEALSSSVASLRCSLQRIANNSSAADGCCPLGWDVFASSCYFFSQSVLSWNESRAWCEEHGAHLLILSTDGQWDFVTGRTVPVFFWVGLTDGRTGQWEWVNRTPYVMQRRRWEPGQPDNWASHNLGGTEDCAHIHSTGRLNDLHCSTRMRYVCQKHSVKAEGGGVSMSP